MASRVDEPPQPTSRLDWQTAKTGFQEKDAWSDGSGVEVEISHCADDTASRTAVLST